MVPDFEIELEAGIEETISEVAEMIADSIDDETPGADNAYSSVTEETYVADIKDKHARTQDRKDAALLKKGSSQTKSQTGSLWSRLTNINEIWPRFMIAAAVILGLFLVFFIIKIVNKVNDYYSFEVQSAKAEKEFIEGDYEEVVKTARHVISLNPKDESIRLLLADSYFSLEKYDEAIAVLNELLEDFPQDITIYERLLHNYETEGDIESIVKLSKQNNNAAVQALFEEYVCEEPSFSVDAGSYFEPQTVRLMVAGEGRIYYTLDGSKPDVNSELYTTPIRLEEGDTVITAVHINSKGIISEPVSKAYSISILTPDIPRLITQGGEYTTPKLIKLENRGDGKIYYTTDGTDPNISSSKEYEPPLPMPLGKSEYRFAVINDSGVSSEVVKAEYELTMSGIIDKKTAEATVQLKLISLGHAVMEHEFKANYGYYANSRNYYIVEEYSKVNGSKRRESVVYAVDSQTAEVFTITRNTKKGDYDFGVVN